MELHQAQKQILKDTHRMRVVVCGRKFGKTTLGSDEMAGCVLQPNKRVLYLAPTLEDARRLMWDKIRNQLRGAIVKENDTRLEIKVSSPLGGYSDLFLGSWEKVQNYRGDEFDLIVPDEVQDYKNFWIGWEALRPTLSPRKGSMLMMGTPKGYNHLYDLYNLEQKDSDFKSFHFTTYDNPFMAKDEIEKAKIQLGDTRFNQEYLAEFTKMVGLVYDDFDRFKHVYTDEVFDYTEYLGGIDFGFTNPCAILSVKVKDGHYYVNDELYKTGLTDMKVAEYTQAKKYSKVYPDPENAAAIQELRNKGINVREVVKGKDSIKNGINKVRELLVENKLHIHSSCINLINEFEAYSYPEDSDSELPADEFNHALDALRYIVMMHSPQKKIIHGTFRDQYIDIWRGK